MIKLFNTLTKKEEDFIPSNPNNVTLYVCGPTVYSNPHIGNARSIVIYDLLFRLLLRKFPKVTYARNITDIDDKINQAAIERKITIQQLTKEVTAHFYNDISILNVLKPTFEPKATENIEDMINLIAKLIKNNHAYVNQNHVLFDVNSFKDYGKLSNRSLEAMIAGTRIEVADYKKNPLDFVLWKPADKNDDASSIFDSPWGKGRPGWHIECSAMSSKYLGTNFDIHGGGIDLQFPHHENEIAQSRCANKGTIYAKYWVHNGFLTVNGEKMSKSLGNFITVHSLKEKNIPGIVIRYLLLSAHYRKPLDFNDKNLLDATKSINKFYSIITKNNIKQSKNSNDNRYLQEVIDALSRDLNTPIAFSILHKIVKLFRATNDNQKKIKLSNNLIQCLNFLGIYDKSYVTKLNINSQNTLDESYVTKQINLRKQAKLDKNWQLADEIRDKLLSDCGIILKDSSDGKTTWSIK